MIFEKNALNKFSGTVKCSAMFILLFSSAILSQDKIINNKITEFLTDAFKFEFTPGMAVGVVKDGNLIYSKGFGVTNITTQQNVTPETLFYIASTTKSFTAFAAAILDNEGILKLDNSFTDYLPGFEFSTSLKDSVITLRSLLTHTHSIEISEPIGFRTSYTGEFTNDLLLDLLKNQKSSESGRRFEYSNLGYIVYGLLMDENLDSGWKEVLDQKIFKPLGMKNTLAYIEKSDVKNLAMPHFIQPENFKLLHYGKSSANMHAAGGHITNVKDLSKWLIVQINKGKMNGEQIFPETVINETHRLQAEQDRKFGSIHRYGWGLGWDLGTYEGDTLIHRFGSFTGFRSHVSFMPNKQLGVIVLVNEPTIGSYFADFIAEYLYDTILKKPGVKEEYEKALNGFAQQAKNIRKSVAADVAKRAARSQDLPFPLSNYTGEYVNPMMGKVKISLKGSQLYAQAGAAESEIEVYSAKKNQLRVELTGSGEVITYTFDEKGNAEKFVLNGFNFQKIK